MKKVELLAPAGNYESFLGAIHAGADAVYLGGDKFGARAYAGNFQEEELCRAIRYAHLFGKKVYLTVNTLIKEQEFDSLYEYLLPFYEAGLDAVIVQDIGVFSYIREVFPDMPLHVSTQMTVTGEYGAEFLKKEGAARIVPARELSLEEIRCIKNRTGIEIEAFIHGAMCYCYSGQCLFSSILGGRSGNRGRCAQPCRLPYEVSREGRPVSGASYPLSLKDMCTIHHIPELIQAGIDSFKIEGRMKKPEYAAGVTAIYRKYIDRYYENPKGPNCVCREDMEALEALYIRSEIQDGYYYKHNGAEMVTEDKPSYRGSDEKLLKDIREAYIEKGPSLPISIYACFRQGEPASAAASCRGIWVSVTGNVVQKALKQPVSAKNIEEGLQKLGGTVFFPEEITVEAQKDIFCPLREINELRRLLISELEEKLLQAHSPGTLGRRIIQQKMPLEVREVPAAVEHSRNQYLTELRRAEHTAAESFRSKKSRFHISVSKKEQLQALLDSSILPERIYLDSDMCREEEEWTGLLQQVRTACEAKGEKPELYIAMPYILRRRDHAYLERIWQVLCRADGCLFRNLETYGYLTAKGYAKPLCSDAGVYIWNTWAAAFWKEKTRMCCLPYELNRKEQKALIQGGNGLEQVVYGYLPMMVAANCVAKTTGGCEGRQDRAFGSYVLKDRYQKKFPVYTNCEHCYNVIYNSVPLSLHAKWEEKPENICRRLDFTVETKKETAQVLEYFEKLDKNPALKPTYGDYTTGHEKRGAE